MLTLATATRSIECAGRRCVTGEAAPPSPFSLAAGNCDKQKAGTKEDSVLAFASPT